MIYKIYLNIRKENAHPVLLISTNTPFSNMHSMNVLYKDLLRKKVYI